MPTETDLAAWIGRQERTEDVITLAPVSALAATLDLPHAGFGSGDVLPPLWHWMYFLSHVRHSALGDDGHARRGGFLPPVPLPRRMWAGGRFAFRTPVRIGDRVSRTSTIDDVRFKHGRSGPLAFVTVRHDVRRDGEDTPALTEFHDIVYRDAPAPGETPATPTTASHDATWVRDVDPDPVVLFRYSALTFNGHRIHYDRRYATEVEGYPGLVVHGPLIATLLLDLLNRHAPDADVASFRFRAVRPTFDGHTFRLHGRPSTDGRTVALWAQDHEGWLTMDAEAALR